MITIEIEFKDGRRMETEKVGHFNFPYWEDDKDLFLTIYSENDELLYAINASEILIMAVEYEKEKNIEESFNALSQALEESTVDSADSLSEIQKFLQVNGFDV